MTRAYAILEMITSCTTAVLLALALLAVPTSWADDPHSCDEIQCPMGQVCVNGLCQQPGQQPWCYNDSPPPNPCSGAFCVTQGKTCKPDQILPGYCSCQ